MSSFQETGEVILDGSGNGTIRLDPARIGTVRQYTRLNVSISTGEASLGGNAVVYAGDTIPTLRVDGSITPWSDTATFAAGQCQVIPSEQLTVVFSACDPGAIARINASYELVVG